MADTLDNVIEKGDYFFFFISALVLSHNLVRVPASDKKPLATKYAVGVFTLAES